jgi:hypothetical protein
MSFVIPERSEESRQSKEQSARQAGEDSRSIEIPRFARNDKRSYFQENPHRNLATKREVSVWSILRILFQLTELAFTGAALN